MRPPPVPPATGGKFASASASQRKRLLALRALIFEVANQTPGVGRLEEALKWGQPSYLTPETKAGTTVRIDAHANGGVALYVNCQTDLVETFRRHYPELSYEGDRAVVLAADTALPDGPLRHMLALTLTYHARKRRG